MATQSLLWCPGNFYRENSNILIFHFFSQKEQGQFGNLGPVGVSFGLFLSFITLVCLFKPYGFAKKNLLMFTRNKQSVEQAFTVINSFWQEGTNRRSTATIKAVLLLKVNVNDTCSVINWFKTLRYWKKILDLKKYAYAAVESEAGRINTDINIFLNIYFLLFLCVSYDPKRGCEGMS